MPKLDRVNVVGTSGSGKSQFSRELARRIGVQHIELDALFWGPDWTQPTDELFFQKIRAAIEKDRWVLDGNYNRMLSIKWERVSTVIWLDYSLTRVLLQAVKRALTRAIMRTELWPGTGNRESIMRSFFSKSSILLWTLNTHGSMKERYEKVLRDPQYQHIQFVRLKNPREAKRFIDGIPSELNLSS